MPFTSRLRCLCAPTAPAVAGFVFAAAICSRESQARADEPAPAPAAAPAAAPAPAPASSKTVTLELQANHPHATIERRTSTTTLAGLPFADVAFGAVGTWEQTCVAPCELKLDPHFSYRVSGDGLVPSDSFALPRDREKLTLDAQMGSSSGRLAGIVLTGLGAGGMLLGGAAIIATPILDSQDVGSHAFRSGLLAGGVLVLGAGALTAGAGLYLWLTNGTIVRGEHGMILARDERTQKPKLEMSGNGLVF